MNNLRKPNNDRNDQKQFNVISEQVISNLNPNNVVLAKPITEAENTTELLLLTLQRALNFKPAQV